MHAGNGKLTGIHKMTSCAKCLGRLIDFGLGNPEGIPSNLANVSDEELQEIAEQCRQSLVDVTDTSAYSCIDGRRKLRNADGTHAEIRYCRVGGSASNLGVAMNGESPVMDTLTDASLDQEIQIVDEFIGCKCSSHEGACGGANGEISDDEEIYKNPHILAAVKAFMAIPEVREYFEVDYDDALGERVRVNAGKTAETLRRQGWDGAAFVQAAKKRNPHGVEVLETADDKFLGHKEKMLKIIIGDKASSLENDFTWNLKASKDTAAKLAGIRGAEGYTQALIAEIAKHFAVANRLPSDKTPVILVAA